MEKTDFKTNIMTKILKITKFKNKKLITKTQNSDVAKGQLMWPKATGYGQRPHVMDGNLNKQLNSMLRMLYWVFKL